jgi:hypothetical protein
MVARAAQTTSEPRFPHRPEAFANADDNRRRASTDVKMIAISECYQIRPGPLGKEKLRERATWLFFEGVSSEP